jgi:hypothetical protein
LNTIQAPSRVTVTRGPLFTRRGFNRERYLMELWVGDINTGLHWHLSRKEAKSLPQIVLDNAAELLDHYGLMEEVYARYARLEDMRAYANMPVKGSKVRLKRTIADGLDKDTWGTVTHVDTKPDAPYPLTVAFIVDGKPEEVPVELEEVEAV